MRMSEVPGEELHLRFVHFIVHKCYSKRRVNK